jgi:short-subunit dehydrogenase
MIAQKTGGHIVNTASMAGLIPTWVPGHVPYSGSKAGVIALSLNLRGELEAENIGISVLCPGGVATNILATPQYRPERFGGPLAETLAPPSIPARPSATTAVRREPDEVAAMVVGAIKENRAFVHTDVYFRQLLADYYRLIDSAFDAL